MTDFDRAIHRAHVRATARRVTILDVLDGLAFVLVIGGACVALLAWGA